jgi:hypothetical protein
VFPYSGSAIALRSLASNRSRASDPFALIEDALGKHVFPVLVAQDGEVKANA